MTGFDTSPLVVITRDAREENGLADALSRHGVRSRALPTIRIDPPADARALADALAVLGSFDWVLFTSGHAVSATCGHPVWSERWHGPRHPAIGAVGPATAARLAAYGVTADLVAEPSSGEGLAAALLARAGSLCGRRMLWPRSNIAGRAMYDRLTAAGAVVVDPEAYRTQPVRPGALELFVSDLAAGRVDAVAFLSPSSAQALAAALDGSLRTLHGGTCVAAIGPTTAAALAHLGAPPDVVPAAASAPALAEAIVRRLAEAGVTR